MNSEHSGTAHRTTSPQTVEPSQGLAAPERLRIVGGPYELEAHLFLPAGGSVAAGIVWNHGSEREPSLRYLGRTARWFQSQGFAVLVPYRRGAAGSGGPHWSDRADSLTSDQLPSDAAVVRALEEEVDDVKVAGQWLARHRRVAPDRVFAAGCSFGGIVTMLASEDAEPFRAALNFAGASIIWDRSPAMRRRLCQAAAGSQVPVFFLQAANDFNTAPSEELAAEMKRAGKPHRKRIFAAFGDSPEAGHAGFCNLAQDLWGAEVLDFLAST